MKEYDIVIIGGGPAGLAAAVKAYDSGSKNILIVERDMVLGGILNQCIHNGFGLHRFKEELTGPEYASRFIKEVEDRNIDYLLQTTVVDLSKEKELTLINEKNGLFKLNPKAIILAMGCRERPRGALNIPGSRPSGIFSAGSAQRLINIDGYLPGKKVVILGSGDIGLIMARRMTLEGAKVQCVAELMPYSGGLKRNIVQCLNDFNIPLFYSTTVSKIVGKERIEGVYLAKVDDKRNVIKETEKFVECDTLLLSVGLIPENELTREAEILIDQKTKGAIVDDKLMTNIEGVFACGNVLHVHDLVDYVSEESELAGLNAAKYVQGKIDKSEDEIKIDAGFGINYTLPQKLAIKTLEDDITVRFRVNNIYQSPKIGLYFDGIKISSRNKKAVAPGEMEKLLIKKDDVKKYNPKKIEIALEV
ncbi:MAG: FAD-dependent oxidoreductase [Peptoniphilaceae bacterium]|nr:FAD-dependent oxidoreductase [Peptoniphilaceae bacterium]MDD7383121.1 FAD-dependent oxidoreductase [Peptoniphilaceae bacterium]MDY3738367.1 FAD-dependent oxidoreductase [Peptoniphilaceae bacterium]